MQALLAITLLLIVPATCAWMFRRLNVTGWAIIGGVVAGILLGPTLLGRVLPNTYEAAFVGGMSERLALDQLAIQHAAETATAQQAGADMQVLQALQQTHSQELHTANVQLLQARWENQWHLRAWAVSLIVITLLGSESLHQRHGQLELHGSFNQPLTIGLWAATIPGGAALLMSTWLWQQSAAHAALIASAVMIGPWTLSRVDVLAAERAERGGSLLMQRAGLYATTFALLVACWALWVLRGLDGLLWLLPLIAVFAPVMRSKRAAGITLPTSLRRVLHFVVIPSLAASVMLKVDLHQHFAIWPLLVLVLLTGDGRWTGAVVGSALLGGRPAMQCMKLSLGAMACGPTQLAVVAIAAHAWLLDSFLILALVAGVVYVEATTSMRRWVATW